MAATQSPFNHTDRLLQSTRMMRMLAFHTTAEFLRHPSLTELFPEFLYYVQCITRAVAPLMETAIEQARQREDDPVCAPLVRYLEKHLEEERGHDDWCAQDLTILGMSREKIFARIPPPNVAALMGSQYYWIRHHHPIAIMGYLSAIELNPPKPKHVEDMIRNTGLPREAFASMAEHALLDQDHKAELAAELNALPLNEAHHAVLEMSAFQTFRYLALILDDLMKNHQPVAGED